MAKIILTSKVEKMTSLLCITALVATFALVVSAQAPQPTPAAIPAILANGAQNCTLLQTKPDPVFNQLSLKNCVIFHFGGYLKLGQNFIDIKNASVNTSVSTCVGNTTSKLVIDFACGSLEIGILHNATSKQVGVENISGSISLPINGKPQIVGFSYDPEVPQFNMTKPGHYYVCKSEQTLPMKVVSPPSQNTTDLALLMTNFSYDAFRDVNGTEFSGIADYCLADAPPVSDWVRVAVGLCLVALVAIVLIAYFVGRRRWSERSSYESV